ncbi:TIGR03905 family TSCPD domain-containing protein [Fusobacterium perfoetens]|uniref:TIGR03905 family TSCPD domain-containing protein n=1 Tax=Fusobacterium perfoetens TaxID=852 RepID=UPI0004804864|nr:TIGR03905 family TSCPD domain-containing protein [Fusobacterium perfoetens]MCI6151515.1 TIGR03905 family TSCPD domain-containing protein [Fusobacterium perfoetens]MDY3236736.1 TIGR03905 family TSCPD domain-containing protein [Fusobacterium perfoetens]
MKKFITSGVCAREIALEIDDNGIIKNIEFLGGCDGNTHGIENLIIGMSKEDVIKKLKGITCGKKSTSCPDQLAKILEENF